MSEKAQVYSFDSTVVPDGWPSCYVSVADYDAVAAERAALLAANESLAKDAERYRQQLAEASLRAEQAEKDFQQVHKNCVQARDTVSTIYRELMRVAPWTESNDMLPVDEILCGIGLLVQERDAALAASASAKERTP